MLGLNGDQPEQSYSLNVEDDPWLSSIHPDDRASALQALQSHLKNDTPFNTEYRFQRSGESFRWYHSSGRAVRDKNGAATRMVGTIGDITPRKRAEEGAAANDAYYHALFESETTGISVTRANGSYVATNPVYQRMLGYSAGELKTMR